jgi:thioredoxin 1
MKHLFLATLLLTSCTTATHPTKAVITEYKQVDDLGAFTQFLHQTAPANRVPIVYFYADWCGPCRRFRAALPSEQVDEALQQATVIKVNVDSCQELAAYYHVTAVPTFVKVDGHGKPVATITSAEWGEDEPAEIAPVMAKLANSATYNLK